MADDPIIQRIESFRCRRGHLLAERHNRGYTLYRASSGALVARLRPTGQDDRVEVLYWAHRTAARPSPRVHRLRGHLLGYPIAVPRHRNCGKSSYEKDKK